MTIGRLAALYQGRMLLPVLGKVTCRFLAPRVPASPLVTLRNGTASDLTACRRPPCWAVQTAGVCPKPGSLSSDRQGPRRAGHGVAVLLRVYAGCIDGHEQLWNTRIDDALRDETAR